MAMILHIKKRKGMGLFMFLFGIFATMPILQLFSITFYVYFLLLFFGITMVLILSNKIKFNFAKVEKLYLMVVVSTIVSCVISFLRMPEAWKQGWGTSLFQFMIVFLFYIFFITTDYNDWIKAYVDGVYVASVIHMIWGYFQLILYPFEIDLNKVVFNKWLNMVGEDFVTQYFNDSIKASGLCWNSGNLAPLLVFGYVYSKHYIIKFLFIILGIISGSRTAAVGILFCILLEIFIKLRNTYMVNKNILCLICIGIIILLVFWLFDAQIFIRLLSKLEYAFSGFFKAKDTSANVHLRYITSVFSITKLNDMVNNLFGFGMGCSGYVFAHYFGQYVGKKWVVESDYINYLWNYGYVGFALYYIWYVKHVIISGKVDYRYLVLFLGFLFQGIFYNVSFNWTNLLIIAVFILSGKGKNIFMSE